MTTSDENTCTVDGTEYRARETPFHVQACAGCARSDQRLLASEAAGLCKGLAPCTATTRADKRTVVWVVSIEKLEAE